MEEVLKAMGYSEIDEKRFLKVLSRGLREQFPNPTRSGCPPADVLERIAGREIPLSEAEPWLDHLTSCSPCYIDFCKFRAAHRS
jgi:hypothetical protein